jgi:hypothetical protein
LGCQMAEMYNGRVAKLTMLTLGQIMGQTIMKTTWRPALRTAGLARERMALGPRSEKVVVARWGQVERQVPGSNVCSEELALLQTRLDPIEPALHVNR